MGLQILEIGPRVEGGNHPDSSRLGFPRFLIFRDLKEGWGYAIDPRSSPETTGLDAD